MHLLEHVPLGPKTTMRIGGTARYFAKATTREDVEEAHRFAIKHEIPLIVLGAGSNTIFADGIINAFILQICNQRNEIQGDHVIVGAGAVLASVIVTLSQQGLDLSALTGIPGTLGGAIFGNAGQGPQGVWIDSFVENVTVFINGAWKILSREECGFSYRESAWKREAGSRKREAIIWEASLRVPRKNPADITKIIAETMKKRRETQIQARTAGSCFKALPDGTPAWKILDAAGLRGYRVGGISISEKHANFLVNPEGKGTFADAVAVIEHAKKVSGHPLGLEMRLFGEDGRVREA
jgi:UDP-N-acetylmuramate dehydrogenase